MDRNIVVAYLNNTLNYGYGTITSDDAKCFSIHIQEETNEFIHPEVIIRAAQNSTGEMLEKYKSGLWNALVKKYNIEVVTFMSMTMQGETEIQEQIIGYN